MKNNLLILFLVPFFITGVSQNAAFEYQGRMTPVVKKEKLADVVYLKEIMPEFGRYFSLPSHDLAMLKERKQLDYPQEYLYPRDNYNNLMEFVSINITANCNGKSLCAESNSDRLTAEQKNIINQASLGTDIRIAIRFRHKASRHVASDNKIVTGYYGVTVVPETEAEYAGGLKQVAKYIMESVVFKTQDPAAVNKVKSAVVNFIVNEEGRVVNAYLQRTSTDVRIDKLILDALHNMPAWLPAKNSKGKTVKQEFNIPLGGGGC